MALTLNPDDLSVTHEPDRRELHSLLAVPARTRPRATTHPTGVRELAEAIWFPDKHPRWPKGAKDAAGKDIGGKFMRVGQSFMADGHRWEVSRIAEGKVIAQEGSGKINQAETRVFDPKLEEIDGAKVPVIPDAALAPQMKLVGGSADSGQPQYNTPITTLVDPKSHDKKIKLPAGSPLSEEEWKQFGKVDQLYYREVMARWGVWHQKPWTDTDYNDAPLQSQVNKIFAAADADPEFVGLNASEIVKSAFGQQYGSSTGESLSLSNLFSSSFVSLGDASRKYQAAREVESEINGLLAWDLYNRLHSPDITLLHTSPNSEGFFSQVVNGKIPVMSGLSNSWLTGVKFGPNTLGWAAPIRSLVMGTDLLGSFGHSFGHEHEYSVADRVLVSPAHSAFWTEYSIPESSTNGVWKWIKSHIKSKENYQSAQPAPGHVIRTLAAHLSGKAELPGIVATPDFVLKQTAKQAKEKGYWVPPDSFMKMVEAKVLENPGKTVTDKIPVKDLKLTPGDVVEGNTEGLRYLVIVDTNAPTGLSYLALNKGAFGNYDSEDKKYTFSSWESTRKKVDLHFDLPAKPKPKPKAAEKVYDLAEWEPVGVPQKLNTFKPGGIFRFNGDDWVVVSQASTQTSIKSRSNGSEASMNPLFKVQPIAEAHPWEPSVGVSAMWKDGEGGEQIVSITGKSTGKKWKIATVDGLDKTVDAAQLGKPPRLYPSEVSKGDTFAWEGAKWTVTTVKKDGTINAKKTGGKVQPFKPDDVLGSVFSPDMWAIGGSAKIGEVSAGVLVSGSSKAKRPYMVLGSVKWPAESGTLKTWLRNLDTGEVVEVSGGKSYHLLVAPEDVIAPTVEVTPGFATTEDWATWTKPTNSKNVTSLGLQVGDMFESGVGVWKIGELGTAENGHEDANLYLPVDADAKAYAGGVPDTGKWSGKTWKVVAYKKGGALTPGQKLVGWTSLQVGDVVTIGTTGTQQYTVIGEPSPTTWLVKPSESAQFSLPKMQNNNLTFVSGPSLVWGGTPKTILELGGWANLQVGDVVDTGAETDTITGKAASGKAWVTASGQHWTFNGGAEYWKVVGGPSVGGPVVTASSWPPKVGDTVNLSQLKVGDSFKTPGDNSGTSWTIVGDEADPSLPGSPPAWQVMAQNGHGPYWIKKDTSNFEVVSFAAAAPEWKDLPYLSAVGGFPNLHVGDQVMHKSGGVYTVAGTTEPDGNVWQLTSNVPGKSDKNHPVAGMGGTMWKLVKSVAQESSSLQVGGPVQLALLKVGDLVKGPSETVYKVTEIGDVKVVLMNTGPVGMQKVTKGKKDEAWATHWKFVGKGTPGGFTPGQVLTKTQAAGLQVGDVISSGSVEYKIMDEKAGVGETGAQWQLQHLKDGSPIASGGPFWLNKGMTGVSFVSGPSGGHTPAPGGFTPGQVLTQEQAAGLQVGDVISSGPKKYEIVDGKPYDGDIPAQWQLKNVDGGGSAFWSNKTMTGVAFVSGPSAGAAPVATPSVTPEALPDAVTEGGFHPYGSNAGPGGKYKHDKIKSMAEGSLFVDTKGKPWMVKKTGGVPVITDGQTLFQVNGDLRGKLAEYASKPVVFEDHSPPVGGVEKQQADGMVYNILSNSLTELWSAGKIGVGSKFLFAGHVFTLEGGPNSGPTGPHATKAASAAFAVSASDDPTVSLFGFGIPTKFAPLVSNDVDADVVPDDGWVTVSGHPTGDSLGLQAGDLFQGNSGNKFKVTSVEPGAFHPYHAELIEKNSNSLVSGEVGDVKSFGNPVVKAYKKGSPVDPHAGWTQTSGHTTGKDLGLQVGDMFETPGGMQYKITVVDPKGGPQKYYSSVVTYVPPGNTWTDEKVGDTHDWGNPVVKWYSGPHLPPDVVTPVPANTSIESGMAPGLLPGKIYVDTGDKGTVAANKLKEFSVARMVKGPDKGKLVYKYGSWFELGTTNKVTLVSAQVQPMAVALASYEGLVDVGPPVKVVSLPVGAVLTGPDGKGHKYMVLKHGVDGTHSVQLDGQHKIVFTSKDAETLVQPLGEGDPDDPNVVVAAVPQKVAGEMGSMILPSQMIVGDMFENDSGVQFVVTDVSGKKVSFKKTGGSGSGVDHGEFDTDTSMKYKLIGKGGAVHSSGTKVGDQVKIAQLEVGDVFLSKAGSSYEVTGMTDTGPLYKEVGPDASPPQSSPLPKSNEIAMYTIVSKGVQNDGGPVGTFGGLPVGTYFESSPGSGYDLGFVYLKVDGGHAKSLSAESVGSGEQPSVPMNAVAAALPLPMMEIKDMPVGAVYHAPSTGAQIEVMGKTGGSTELKVVKQGPSSSVVGTKFVSGATGNAGTKWPVVKLAMDSSDPNAGGDWSPNWSNYPIKDLGLQVGDEVEMSMGKGTVINVGVKGSAGPDGVTVQLLSGATPTYWTAMPKQYKKNSVSNDPDPGSESPVWPDKPDADGWVENSETVISKLGLQPGDGVKMSKGYGVVVKVDGGVEGNGVEVKFDQPDGLANPVYFNAIPKAYKKVTNVSAPDPNAVSPDGWVEVPDKPQITKAGLQPGDEVKDQDGDYHKVVSVADGSVTTTWAHDDKFASTPFGPTTWMASDSVYVSKVKDAAGPQVPVEVGLQPGDVAQWQHLPVGTYVEGKGGGGSVLQKLSADQFKWAKASSFPVGEVSIYGALPSAEWTVAAPPGGEYMDFYKMPVGTYFVSDGATFKKADESQAEVMHVSVSSEHAAKFAGEKLLWSSDAPLEVVDPPGKPGTSWLPGDPPVVGEKMQIAKMPVGTYYWTKDHESLLQKVDVDHVKWVTSGNPDYAPGLVVATTGMSAMEVAPAPFDDSPKAEWEKQQDVSPAMPIVPYTSKWGHSATVLYPHIKDVELGAVFQDKHGSKFKLQSKGVQSAVAVSDVLGAEVVIPFTFTDPKTGKQKPTRVKLVN